MAATVLAATPRGTRTQGAGHNALIVLAETNQLTTKSGHLSHLVVWSVGTTFTVDVYDSATGATTNHLWSWVTADGKGIYKVDLPIQTGLYVVTTGTPGGLDVVYD